MRLISSYSIDDCLSEHGDECYIRLYHENDSERRINVFLVWSGNHDRYFVLSDCGALHGGEPSDSQMNYIRDAHGIDRLGSWALDVYCDGSIRDAIEWYNRDRRRRGDESRYWLVEMPSGSLESPLCPRTEFVLDSYTTDAMYTGLHSYHHSHSCVMNRPTKEMKEGQYRIGVELEIEAKNCGNKSKINRVKSNWFFQETDGSLGSYGIELITIPLLPKDAMSMSTWSPLVDFLSPMADSWSRDSCGLHIHIGREAFGKDEDSRQATLGKLLYFYYSKGLKDTPWNIKVFGRRRTYSETDFRCKEADAVAVLGEELMKDEKIRAKVDKGLKDAANITRYYDINVQNSATIEFRKGKGSICAERIVSVITYCDLMVRYVRNRDWDMLSVDDFLDFIRAKAPKSSPIFRYLPTRGEEE
jgi:hypothetical protein